MKTWWRNLDRHMRFAFKTLGVCAAITVGLAILPGWLGAPLLFAGAIFWLALWFSKGFLE